MFLSQPDLFLIPMFSWSLGLEVSLHKFPYYSHFREDVLLLCCHKLLKPIHMIPHFHPVARLKEHRLYLPGKTHNSQSQAYS